MIGRFIALVLAAVAVTATLTGAFAEDHPPYGKQKVVYHVNYDAGANGKGYKAALGNIQNHINAIGKDNITVKVVMHGDGLGLLKAAKDDLTLQGTISNLKNQNVSFAVCNNTLKGRKISYENDLFDVYPEDIVPSGVAELSYLQQQGFTYIKP